MKSVTSYVYSSRRPRKWATNANRDPSCSGRGVFHSPDSVFPYHSVAFDGSESYAATSAIGRSIVVSVTTSTGMGASRGLRLAKLVEPVTRQLGWIVRRRLPRQSGLQPRQ